MYSKGGEGMRYELRSGAPQHDKQCRENDMGDHYDYVRTRGKQKDLSEHYFMKDPSTTSLDNMMNYAIRQNMHAVLPSFTSDDEIRLQLTLDKLVQEGASPEQLQEYKENWKS